MLELRLLKPANYFHNLKLVPESEDLETFSNPRLSPRVCGRYLGRLCEERMHVAQLWHFLYLGNLYFVFVILASQYPFS